MLLTYIILSVGDTHQIVDLSESMMEIAIQRMEREGPRLMPSTLIADATSLPYSAASFDRYISNMTLHYAPDGDAFLAEAARILTDGGLAGFTVWGHEELSSAFTLLPDVKKKLNLMKAVDDSDGAPVSRSSYHMGENDEVLRQRVIAAGFRTCVIWHASAVIEALSAENFAQTMIDGANSTKQEYLGWSHETQTLFRSEVVSAASIILERGDPLSLDVCYCVATK
jgi:ubiquinone/menaquinone biosynthesis C-methylase UbiE